MKQNISIFMDGELCTDEAEVLLAEMKSHPEARQEWLAYHLIGDALRQPDYMTGELKADFLERLHAEPTVLAPKDKKSTKSHFLLMSAVASVMAIAFLAWVSVQIENKPFMQQQIETMHTVSFSHNADISTNDNMNDYLLAHHEFAPATDMRGAASYIRTVADVQSGVGR